MNRLIAACFDRSRVVVVGLLLIVLWGAVVAYEIPKEADPDVQLPIVYVSLSHEGISPEDAERLLVRPMERELQVLEGLKEMRSTSSQGHASVLLEFEAGVDIDQALIDVREKVDRAKAELPDETDEPIVEEVNLSLFPVLVVTLAGAVPERTLLDARARPAGPARGAARRARGRDRRRPRGGGRDRHRSLADRGLRPASSRRSWAWSSATTSWSPPAPGTSARAGSRSRCRA